VESQAREWEVIRRGGTVCVDVTRAAYLSDEDHEALLATTEDLLQDDEVSIVLLQGSIPRNPPPAGLARVLKALSRLAEQYDRQLVVGPI
jgi:fructose-1-phosphate kinase PfkB-like protein